MNNPRLAARYAKSLLDLAEEQGQLESVYEDMKSLASLARQNPQFVSFLKSPVMTAEKKQSVLDEVLAGRIHDLTHRFIQLLLKKTREANLPEMAKAFIQQYNKIKGIYPVKITTALPLSAEMEDVILEKIRRNPEFQNIELNSVVDPSLIGGFKLQLGDQLVDASILHDLQDVGKQFLDNEYIHKIR